MRNSKSQIVGFLTDSIPKFNTEIDILLALEELIF